MKNKSAFFFIFLIMIFLSIVSYGYLDRAPVSFFILKSQTNRVVAFKVLVYLNHRLSIVIPLRLNGTQQTEAVQILSTKSIYQMESLASSFGQFDFVIGDSEADQDIDHFWNDFSMNRSLTTNFNNLAGLDKLYFTLIAEQKLSVQNSDEMASSVGVLSPLVITPTAIVQVKKAASKSIVHVEILNGCGIKGAADWVVLSISSQTILAKNGGNAVNFNYANSQLLFAAADFPDLEKALTKLGFFKLNSIGSSVLPAGYDGVFIVGKDFQKVKGN
jgi:hypothetical protein